MKLLPQKAQSVQGKYIVGKTPNGDSYWTSLDEYLLRKTFFSQPEVKKHQAIRELLRAAIIPK